MCQRWPCNHCSSFCPLEVALVPLKPAGVQPRRGAAAAAPHAEPELKEPGSPMAGEAGEAALLPARLRALAGTDQGGAMPRHVRQLKAILNWYPPQPTPQRAPAAAPGCPTTTPCPERTA